MEIKRGRTSQIVPVKILDITLIPIGGKTGLVFNSTNLIAYYKRELDTQSRAITLADMTPLGTWTTGGFKEVDSVHMPGRYDVGLPNAAISASDASTWVDIVIRDSGTGLGIADSDTRFDLKAIDTQDAVAFGLSRIDAAISSRMATFTLPTNFASMLIDSSGRVTVGAIINGAIAAATFAANALDAVWSTAARTLTAFGFSVTVGTNNDKSGYALTSGEHTAISGTDVPTGLTAQGYSTTRAGYLDVLNGIVAAVQSGLATIANQTAINNNVLGVPALVWSYVTRTLTGGSSPTVQQIVDGVWNELRSSHTVLGSAMEALSGLYAKIIFVNPPNSTNTLLVPVRLDFSPVVPPAEYVINTLFTLTATFRDSTGALIDPTGVAFWSLPPGTGSIPVALTPVTHVSTGLYTAPWEPSTDGNWTLTVKSTGPAIHLVDQVVSVLNSFEP